MGRPARPFRNLPRLSPCVSWCARLAAILAIAGAWTCTPALAQPAARVVTNVPALLTYPAFYHLRSVVVRGDLSTSRDRTLLTDESEGRGVEVVFTKGSQPDRVVELRGVYMDIGRMTADDPHFASIDIQAFLDGRTGGAWPKPGELLVVVASDVQPAPPLPAPSVRTIVLDPVRYKNQSVTVVGEFRGSNLYGDLPRAPTSGKWDFVLRSASAAMWVSGLRPKGRGFDLDPHARVDTGRVLEVTGVVKADNGLVWLEASAISAPAITEVLPRDEPPDANLAKPAPPAPPPEVIFSLPTEGDSDVSPSAPIRIQLSRNLNPETFGDRIRVTYVGAAPPDTPQAGVGISTAYVPADRLIEIRCAKPLAPYRTIKVELLEGITGTDGQPLKPWTLTFTTGAQ